MTHSTDLVASTAGPAGTLATVDPDSYGTSSEDRSAADSYRFEHFDFSLMLQDMRFSRGSLRAGIDFPTRLYRRSTMARSPCASWRLTAPSCW